MNTEQKTKVIFYLDADNESFAFFPNNKYNNEPGLYDSYAHIGQQSACHIDYINSCKLAKPKEYFGLEKELESIGYDLTILNEREITYHREPTRDEIRFGEGATHYKDMPFSLVYKWSPYGLDFKKWTVCPYDNLRYYQ